MGAGSLRVAAIAGALVVATFAAYWGSPSNGFVQYDDDRYVSENVHMRGGLKPASVAWAFTTTEQANWHPLTWLSHLLDVQLFGIDPGRHHLVSLVLHAANSALLFLLLVRMTGATWRSALAAGWFAVHPLHVESVAWIAERKDVLSTLLWFLTLAAWLLWVASPSRARYALVLVLFALGLMVKPMLVTFPLTLLLLDFWPLRRSPGLLEKAPLFALAAGSAVVTYIVQRGGGAVESMARLPISERLANSMASYAGYLFETLSPTALAVFYPYPANGPTAALVLVSTALVVLTTVLAIASRKRAPYLAVGWLWYLVTLVPVIGWVQVGAQAMADRYTYVPSIGLFVAFAWGLGELAVWRPSLRPVIVAVAAVSLIALAAQTRRQVAYWSNRTTLFSHALAVTRDNWLAHNNLAAALTDAGRYDEAILHLRAALAIRPSYSDAHANLGTALGRGGHAAEALEQFDLALSTGPDNAKLENNWAGALASLGRTADALEHLERAVRLDPDNVEAQFNLARALAAAGRPAEAAAHFEQVLRLEPDDAEAREGLRRAREER